MVYLDTIFGAAHRKGTLTMAKPNTPTSPIYVRGEDKVRLDKLAGFFGGKRLDREPWSRARVVSEIIDLACDYHRLDRDKVRPLRGGRTDAA